MAQANRNILPHLWYDKDAREAAEFYVSIFPNSQVTNVTVLRDTPSGDVETVAFTLWGQKFLAISAGPYFKFNPSVSFIVNFDPSRLDNASEKLDEAWNRLSAYPDSEQCGWLKDRFGLCWQIVPRKMEQMMAGGTPEQVHRLSQATLKMKKLDLAALQRAFKGE